MKKTKKFVTSLLVAATVAVSGIFAGFVRRRCRGKRS